MKLKRIIIKLLCIMLSVGLELNFNIINNFIPIYSSVIKYATVSIDIDYIYENFGYSEWSTLNLRSDPFVTDDNIISTIPEGTVIPIYEFTDEEWCKTSYDGKTGYVQIRHLSFDNLNTETENINKYEEYSQFKKETVNSNTKYGTSIASGKCGDNAIWTAYLDSNIDDYLAISYVVISGTGAMYDDFDIDENICNQIGEEFEGNISIIIEDGITHIGNRNFLYGWSDFRIYSSLTIGNTVESIGDYAFNVRSCYFNDVNIPASVKYISPVAFNCGVTNFYVDKNNSSYISQDGVLFSKDMSKLIIYPGNKSFDGYKVPKSVTDIYYTAFRSFNMDYYDDNITLTILNKDAKFKNTALDDEYSSIPFYYVASTQDGSNYTNIITIKSIKGSPIQSQIQDLNTQASQLGYNCQDIYFEEIPSLDNEDTSQIKWANAYSKYLIKGDFSNLDTDYKNSLNLYLVYQPRFALINIDDDDIPELVMAFGDSGANGVFIIHYDLKNDCLQPYLPNYSENNDLAGAHGSISYQKGIVDCIMSSGGCTIHKIYTSSNGKGVFADQLIYDAPENTYSDSKSEISKDMFDEKCKKYNLDKMNRISYSDMFEINSSNITNIIYSKIDSQRNILAMGTIGSNATWCIYDDNTLVVSGSGNIDFDNMKTLDEKEVFYIGSIHFGESDELDTRINEVIIQDGITGIDNLKSFGASTITLPNTLEKIGTNFMDMYSSDIETLKIPKSVNYIDDNAFQNGNALKKITVDSENQNFVVVDNVLYDKNITRLIAYPMGTSLNNYIVPNTIDTISKGSLLALSPMEWVDFNKDISITIPSSVKKIYLQDDIPQIFCSTNGIGDGVGCYKSFKIIGEKGSLIERVINLINEQVTEIETDSQYQHFNYVTFLGSEPTILTGYCGKNYNYNSKLETNDNASYNLDLSTGILTISGNGEVQCFNERVSPWNDYKNYIRKIIIKDGISKISDTAFINLDNSNPIDIEILNPNTIIENQVNFEQCDNTTIYCFKTSTAEKYAIQNNIKFQYINYDTNVDAIQTTIENTNTSNTNLQDILKNNIYLIVLGLVILVILAIAVILNHSKKSRNKLENKK